MKKVGLIAVSLVWFIVLTSCTFNSNVSGLLAGEAEATAEVEEMMLAMAENRESDAKALMHPQATEKADAAIAQMSTYLDGRKVDSMELTGINVNTSTGSSGKTRQEQATYQVTLDDGVVIHLKVDYLSDDAGAGFSTFQVVIGLV